MTAIITLLAAILFPVFAQSRESARRSACLSNMKQVGLALKQYAGGHDEMMPLDNDGVSNFADAGAVGNFLGSPLPYIQNVLI